MVSGRVILYGDARAPGELTRPDLEQIGCELGHHAEAVRGVIHVGVVDLLRIASEDDLRPLTTAGDDRLDLVRGEVLRLIHDEVLVRQAAPADVRERLDLNGPRLEELEETLGG